MEKPQTLRSRSALLARFDTILEYDTPKMTATEMARTRRRTGGPRYELP